MKRPSFQFYPGDWLRDTALRSCTVGARGLWIDMLCLMHEGTPYGYLKVGEKVIHPSNLARMVGATLTEVEGWLLELDGAGVYSRDEEGCIFSRRMIRDENVRAARAAGGKLGGNPSLKKSEKVNLPTNLELTPSSSSSSSSAIDKPKRARSVADRFERFELPDWVPQEAWAGFVEMRARIRKPLTGEAMRLSVKKLETLRAAGHNPREVLEQSTMNSWQGLFETKRPNANAPVETSYQRQMRERVAAATGGLVSAPEPNKTEATDATAPIAARILG